MTSCESALVPTCATHLLLHANSTRWEWSFLCSTYYVSGVDPSANTNLSQATTGYLWIYKSQTHLIHVDPLVHSLSAHALINTVSPA